MKNILTFASYGLIWILAIITIIISYLQPAFFHESFISLFFVASIPFIDKIITSIEKESPFFLRNREDMNIKLGVWVIIALVLFIVNDFPFIQYFLIISICWGILFAIDERYYFLIALFFLLSTVLLLIIGKEDLANKYSIYLYYILVFGTFISITNNAFQKNIPHCNSTSINTNVYSVPLWQKAIFLYAVFASIALYFYWHTFLICLTLSIVLLYISIKYHYNISAIKKKFLH